MKGTRICINLSNDDKTKSDLNEDFGSVLQWAFLVEKEHFEVFPPQNGYKQQSEGENNGQSGQRTTSMMQSVSSGQKLILVVGVDFDRQRVALTHGCGLNKIHNRTH